MMPGPGESACDGLLYRALHGRVLHLTLNRPDDRNCIVPGMLDGLIAWLEEAQRDPAVGAILLSGAGAHFCAGGSMQALSGSAGEDRSLEDRCERALAVSRVGLLLAEGKPSVAMLRGSVAGGGLALAAACDMRIASPGIRMSFSYARIGLSGDIGATLFLTRLLGPARMRPFALLSPILDAQAALAQGLIDRVVEEIDLDAQALALASQFANLSPQASAAICRNVAAAAQLPAADALAIEAENFARCQMHPDHAEAVRAFTEKRAPAFASAAPIDLA